MMKPMPLLVALMLVIFAPGVLRADTPKPPDEAGAIIRISGDKNFSPYEFINANGQPDGYNIDIMKAIVAKVGLTIDLKLERWADARRALENGRVDALTGVMYSKARDRVFDYSIPHIAVTYALFVRQDATLAAPQDARGRQIIVVRDVYAHDWLQEHEFTDQIIPVDSPADALRLLSESRHDAAVLARLHGLDLLRKLGITNVKTVGPPVVTPKMGIAVQIGNFELLAKFNEGLYLLQRSGEFDDIYRRWFSVYEERALRRRILAVALFIVAPLLLLLIAGGLWIWTLNRSVARKTAALRSNRRTLAQILEYLPIPTLVVNRTGRITHWNRECAQMTGISAMEAIDYSSPPADVATYPSTLLTMLTARCATANGPLSVRHRTQPSASANHILDAEVFLPWLGSDGKWLSGTVVPFEDGQGRQIGTIEAWEDLTDRKMLERQLTQAQKMEAMGTLAGSVAHDFASYLQAIGGFASAAQLDVNLSTSVRAHLDGIQGTIVKARQLIRQIMLFSRKDLVPPSPVDLRPIIERTLRLVKATASANIAFESVFHSDACIMADETQVSQVLLNLCTNAIQAMPAEGGQLSLRVEDVDPEEKPGLAGSKGVSGPFLKLTVADTGCGIPPDQKEKIFEPFFTRRRDEGGTGMGLAIVHGIVRGYGGRIEVKSQEGQGSVFEVFWPAAPASKRRSS